MFDNINQDIHDLRNQIGKLNNASIDATVNKDAELKKKLEEKIPAFKAEKMTKEEKLKEVLQKGKFYNYKYLLFKTN